MGPHQSFVICLFVAGIIVVESQKMTETIFVDVYGNAVDVNMETDGRKEFNHYSLVDSSTNMKRDNSIVRAKRDVDPRDTESIRKEKKVSRAEAIITAAERAREAERQRQAWIIDYLSGRRFVTRSLTDGLRNLPRNWPGLDNNNL